MAIQNGDLLLKGEWFLDALDDGEELDDLMLGLKEAIKVIVLEQDREKLKNVSANRFASLILGNASRMGDAMTKQKINTQKAVNKNTKPLTDPETMVIWALWMEGYEWKEIQSRVTSIGNKKTGVYSKPAYYYIKKDGYLAEKGHPELTPETMCEGNPHDIIMESSLLTAASKNEYLERIGEIQSKNQTNSENIQSKNQTELSLNQTENSELSVNSDLIKSKIQTESEKIQTKKGFEF